MAMAFIWTVIVAFSLVYGILSGNGEAVGAAALSGAGDAVTLCLSICGVMCLWSGVMEVMRRAGIMKAVARLLSPILSRLLKDSKGDKDTMEAVSANVSANLLGLGNAATPLGIKAVTSMLRRSADGSATDDMCTFVVLNTASIQLIPATVAAIRAAAGAKAPLDILPAVWLTSVASVTVGLVAARLMRRFRR